VIGLLVLLAAFLQIHATPSVSRGRPSGVRRRLVELQGQYLVAAAQIPGVRGQQLYENLGSADTGPLWARLSHVVLAGELIGPEEALERLDVIETHREEFPSWKFPRQTRLLDILRSVYADYIQGRWSAPSLNADDATLLCNELGWFGSLALSPAEAGHNELPGSANDANSHPGGSTAGYFSRNAVLSASWRTFLTIVLAALLMVLASISGLAGALVFFVMVVKGKLRSAIRTRRLRAAVYAETFAAWLVFFLTLSLAAGFAGARWQVSHLGGSVLVAALSLVAIAWPLFRGVTWKQMRDDLGLASRFQPLREIVWGVACYVSTFPLMAFALAATGLLLSLSSREAGGGGSGLAPAPMHEHPLVSWALGGGVITRIQILVFACLITPVVEETAFRGVLYTCLRNLTSPWRVLGSVVCSTCGTSLVFAVIHPQGLMGLPSLVAMSIGLCLTREWRGSLLAPISMHATHNGCLMVLLFLLF
jgi:membrane protease YdiL (CAAX protease family)